MRPRDQRGQIRRHGLDWEFRYYEDRMVDGKVKRVRASIAVRRKIWNDHGGAPKTEAREAGVYVVPLLRKVLAKYETSYPPVGADGFFEARRCSDRSTSTTYPGETSRNS
jgi:hypothetical protein